MKNLNEIRVLISLGKLENAIEVSWVTYENHKFKDDVINIRSRFNKFRDDIIKGIFKIDDKNVEESKIRNSLLEFLNKIEKRHAEKSVDNVGQHLDNYALVVKLLEILDETYQGMQAQAEIRDQLYHGIRKRLDLDDTLEYEPFFENYHPDMNAEELEHHKTMRDYTKNILNVYNRKALELILGNKELKSEIPRLKKLERHLLVWLGKYENIFKKTPALNLIYVGVEENVPFPKKMEKKLRKYLEKNKAK